MLISRARPTINLPCISPQSSVMCNGQYCRHVIKAQPFQDVDTENGERKTYGAMSSTFKRTDSHTLCCRPTQKDGVVIYNHIFQNELFHEPKMSIESHDLVKILQQPRLHSNQKSNELSMNRTCEQSYCRRKKKHLHFRC